MKTKKIRGKFSLAIILMLLFSASHPLPSWGLSPSKEENRYRALSTLKGEFRLGVTIAGEIERKYNLLPDEDKIRRVNRIGLAVASQSGDKEIPYSFNIIDLKEANAFSLPGGFIYVTSGMLALNLSDSELAHLLGHEIVHAEKKHLRERRRVEGLISLLLIALEIVTRGKGEGEFYRGEKGELVASGEEARSLASTLALELLGRGLAEGYSRKQEAEADRLGRIYALKAGFAPEGGVSLLQKLDRWKEKRPNLLENFFRSHPYILDRIREVKRPLGKYETRGKEEDFAERGERIQSFLYQAGGKLKERGDSFDALMLFRNGQQILPRGKWADKCLFELIQHEEKEELKKSPLRINYEKLRREYQKFILTYPKSDLLLQAKGKRDEYERKSGENYRKFSRIIERGEGSTQFLEMFVEFYPQSPYTPRALFQLAENYRLSARYNRALKIYMKLVKEHPASSWGRESKSKMEEVIEKVTDGLLCYQLILTPPSPTLKEKAEKQMEVIIDNFLDLPMANKLLDEFPENPYREKIKGKIFLLAQEKYYQARFFQTTGDRREAIEAYRKLMELAPHTRFAEEARKYFQKLERERNLLDSLP